MKRLHLIILLTIATLSLSSCDDFLDVQSPVSLKTEDFYSTPKEAEQGLTGIYNGLLPISNYNMCMSDLRSDDVWTQPADDKQRDVVDISVFNPNIYTISTLNDAWVDYYKIISRANLFLERVENLDFPAGESVKLSFIGEARFLRALAYFDLVRYFGRIPVAIRTLTSEEVFQLPQSESREVYDKVILPDLLYAAGNMLEEPVTCDNVTAAAGRATIIAAKALLGRVYLTMAGYPLYDDTALPLAEKYLKEVIDYAETTGKYWEPTRERWPHIWISDNDNRYHIFEIQYIAQKDYGNPMVFMSVPNVGTEYVSIKMGGYGFTWAAELASVYNQYPKDIRIDYTIDPAKKYFTKFFEHKIKRSELGYGDIDGQIIDRTYFPINYPLIRLEDVMLMYAEIVGPTDAGVEMVNRIRLRAGLPALPETDLVGDKFLQRVEEERRRELAFEGIRWHDLVRHNTYIEKVRNKFLNQTVDGDGNPVNPQYRKYVNNIQPGTYLYPIPDTQMKARPGLYEQNEAYK